MVDATTKSGDEEALFKKVDFWKYRPSIQLRAYKFEFIQDLVSQMGVITDMYAKLAG